MPNRPAISAKVQREVFVEAGHRCAVCGEPLPLERAHIIPWTRSRDHTVENLICLCANCHARADKENWGEKTLREYKANPWISRRYRVDDTAPRDVSTYSNDRNASRPVPPHCTPVEVHSTSGTTAVTVGDRPLVRRAQCGPVDLEFELTNPNPEEMSLREIYVEVVEYEDARFLRNIPYMGIGQTRRYTCTVKPTVGGAFRCTPTDKEHDFIKLANNELERLWLTVDATCGGLYRLAVTLLYSVGGKVAELRVDGATDLAFLGPTSSIDGITYLRRALDDPETANHRAAALELCEYLDCELRFSTDDWGSGVSLNSDPSHPKLLPILIATLEDMNEWVRRDAARFLGRIGDTAAIPALVDTIHSGGVDDYIATQALGAIGKAALPALSKLLEDSSASRRCNVVEAMSEAGADAIPELKRVLFDRDERVRNTVAESLGNIGNNAAGNALVILLNDAENSVRSTAATQLGYTHNSAASHALRAALEKGNTQAAHALRNLHPPDIEGLTLALASDNPATRLASTEALGSLWWLFTGHPSTAAFGQVLPEVQKATLAGLQQALTDEVAAVRKSAVAGLAEIGSPAMTELGRALCNDDANVGKKTARALTKMGPAAIPTLIDGLLAPNETQEALTLMFYRLGQPALDALRAIKEDGDSSINREAAAVLDKIAALKQSIQSISQAPKITKLPCERCGALILPTTAEKTGGLCMPCYKRESR